MARATITMKMPVMQRLWSMWATLRRGPSTPWPYGAPKVLLATMAKNR